jgi:hypothetical protein
MGNKAAVGNPGPGPRPRLVTSVIIAKLNEIDPKTKRENVFKLVDKLWALAVPKKDSKPGDLQAMKEIIDRADGKVRPAPEGDGDGNTLTIKVVGGLPDRKLE